jgi:hypothetical protein
VQKQADSSLKSTTNAYGEGISDGVANGWMYYL